MPVKFWQTIVRFWFFLSYLTTVSLVVTENGKVVLYGVVSWLPGCGVSEYPGGVFTSVFSMMGFIQDILVSNSLSY